ncbi:hypothetical protein N1851_006350 [Merluccius polli]|uniref:Uncharacterized protein n=1 Tax=Merluccius polli TaxID=89951 RepID=A0AA47P619_MERPO|nr:hypothetical protein N1851_006350 [Merluccius polli]
MLLPPAPSRPRVRCWRSRYPVPGDETSQRETLLTPPGEQSLLAPAPPLVRQSPGRSPMYGNQLICFKPANFGMVTSTQLHNCADACEDGYGTVSYLLLHNNHGQAHCGFVMGKARVAPLKPANIP